MTEPTEAVAATPRPSRRAILTGALGGAAGLAAGVGGMAIARPVAPAPAPTRPVDSTSAGAAVPAAGTHQGGIHSPVTPQRFGRIAVYALPSVDIAWLAALGERILDITSTTSAHAFLPDGPGDLTITVGIGPRLVAAIDPALPGAEDLPAFVGDGAIPESARGGDLLLAAHSSDPTVLGAVLADLAGIVPGADPRWQQFVFRGVGEGSKARNPLGFMDGIIVPRSTAELDENVWIDSGRLAGGTICVIRRLELDTTAFRTLPVVDREAVIGRNLADGSPLSGGGPDDEVDLVAKSPEGTLLTPVASHARAAHPSFTGSALMLRRSYSFESDDAQGLLFIAFQRDLRTFVSTQHRLDEVDALLQFTRQTASATFLILPGFDAATPLGAALAAEQ